MLQPSNTSINTSNGDDDSKSRTPSPNGENDICSAEQCIIPAPVSRFRSTLPQVLATMAQSLLLLALGMMISAPTIVIAALLKNTSETFSIDSTQASWFAGIILICQPIGSILSGVLQEWLGRKKCMLAVNVPQLIGWCLIFTAQSVNTLYIAAILMGFSVGFMEAPTLSYVGEISQPHLRGTLASLTGTYISLGYFTMYLLGTVTKWRTATAISCSVPVITFLAILMIPESPAWLVNKNKLKEAEKALCWLRGWVEPEYVQTELTSLIQYCEVSKRRSGVTRINSDYTAVPLGNDAQVQQSKFVVVFKDLTRSEMLKPLRLVVCYFFFYHCASLSGLRPYMVVVFNSLSLPISSHLLTVLTAVLQLAGGLSCMMLVHRTGKRFLSLFSMSACAIFCMLLGAYTLQLQYSYIVQPWIPLLLICCLFFFTNIGISPLPWTLLAEIFPPRGRGIGGGVSAAMFYVEFFLVSKTFLDLKTLLQLYGVFFFYGALGFVGVIFIYFCLPETEGKKLEEVEKIFARKNSDTESIH